MLIQNYCSEAKIAFWKVDRALGVVGVVGLKQLLLSLCKPDSVLSKLLTEPVSACFVVVIGYSHNTGDNTTAIMSL